MHMRGDLQYEVLYAKKVREVPELVFVGLIGLRVNLAFDELVLAFRISVEVWNKKAD